MAEVCSVRSSEERYSLEASDPAFKFWSRVLSGKYFRPGLYIDYLSIDTSVERLRRFQGETMPQEIAEVDEHSAEAITSLPQLTTLHQRARSAQSFVGSLAVDPGFDGEEFGSWPSKQNKELTSNEQTFAPLDETQTEVLSGLIEAHQAFKDGQTHPLFKGPLLLPLQVG